MSATLRAVTKQSEETISLEQWQSELEKAFAEAEGLSRGDIQQKTGKSAKWADGYLEREIAAGNIIFVGKATRKNRCGDNVSVPIYRKVR